MEFKTAESVRSKAYYEAHKEVIKARARAWHAANRERANAGRLERRHADLLLSRNRERLSYQRHKSKRLAAAAKYRTENREKILASKKKWQSDNWSHRQAYMKDYYAKNRERICAKVMDLYQNHPERWTEYGQRRRARLLGASTDTRGVAQWIRELRLKRRVKCYYCPTVIPGAKMHVDHIVPLAKGGAHAIGNLCASCPTCNLSKNDNLITTWYKEGQQVLSI